MAEIQYHKNDCEICAPLIEAFKKKFNREPDLSEFMVLFFRWAKKGNFGTVEGAERVLNNIGEKELYDLAQEHCNRWYNGVRKCG